MAEWNRAGGDWNHAGAITDWNTVSEWNTAAGGSTGGTAPVITAVTSPRGADIACADETLTITLDDSAGVTSVTVNGVACTNVTIVDATTVTGLCPHGFNALYGATGDVVVSNGTASAGYPVTLRPASDDTEWSFTVNYANLDPKSPWAGDSEFSGLTATSQAVLDNTSLPDGLTASMSGTGVVTLSGTATQDQTLDYYIVDATDLTAGPAGTITISYYSLYASTDSNLESIASVVTASSAPGVSVSSQLGSVSSSVVFEAKVDFSIDSVIENVGHSVTAVIHQTSSVDSALGNTLGSVFADSSEGAAISSLLDTATGEVVADFYINAYVATQLESISSDASFGVASAFEIATSVQAVSASTYASVLSGASIVASLHATSGYVFSSADTKAGISYSVEPVNSVITGGVVPTASSEVLSTLESAIAGVVCVSNVEARVTNDLADVAVKLTLGVDASSGYSNRKFIKVLGGSQQGEVLYKGLTDGNVLLPDNVIVVVDSGNTVVIN